MSENKYDENFVTESPPNPMHPQTREMVNEFGVINTLYINDELQGKLKGAYYLETSLVVKPSPEDRPGGKPHTHDWDEYLVFLGTDPKDPFDLGGEIEFWLGGEKHLVTKSCAIFIPKGVPHCPLYTRSVERPFISFSVGPALSYHPKNQSGNPE